MEQQTKSPEQKSAKGAGVMTLIFFAIVGIIVFFSSDPNQGNDQPAGSTPKYASASADAYKDPYETIFLAFEGSPYKEKVQPMLETVMQRCNMEITDQNILRAGNVLVVLRKDSKIGVTEMEILKHMYQNPVSNNFAVLSAASATILEQTK